MEKFYYVKIPHPSGFNHYIQLQTPEPPEVLELTKNEANKRSYEERLAVNPDMTEEGKIQLRRIFPHD